MRPVLCVGETLIDLIATDGTGLQDATTLAIREGGAPMNVAVGLARLGIPAAFCGVVGNDQFGDRIRALLDREKVDARFLGTTERESTSIAYAWKDAQGDGQFQLMRQADCRLTSTFTKRAMAELQPAAIVVGSVAMASSLSRLGVLAAIREAQHQQCAIVVDLNIRMSQWPGQARLQRVLPGLLRHATLLKLSIDDARAAWGLEDPGQIRAHLAQWTDTTAVITDGSRGVHLFERKSSESVQFPVFPVNAIEPTGAGDAFTAALLSRLLSSKWSRPSDDDIRFAMAAGALTTTRLGALTSLPTTSEIDTFLANAD